MRYLRVIARLDIKGINLIKGIHLEGLRVIGHPNDYATSYYRQGVDELILMDSVASLYGRNNLEEVIMRTAENIFIPITVGGGIRNLDDATRLLRAGADKIAVNTAAVSNPNFLTELAASFGSQSVVLSIEAKKCGENHWEALTNNGRERTGLNVLDWAKKGVELGAGEILLTSVDMEGTRKGFDVDLVKEVANLVSVPVIASGGMGVLGDLKEVIEIGNADAVAFADVIHYNRLTISDIKEYCHLNGWEVSR